MISVVIPILNEQENIVLLLQEILEVSKSVPISEIIYVDDGSTDQSFAILQSLKTKHAFLRVIRHDRRCGQSAAIWTGVKAAGNDLIVMLDGDGQNDPADIGSLYQIYKDCQKDSAAMMIAGERKKRNDVWIKRVSSRFANHFRASLLKDKTRDTGCSLKLFRRKDYLALPYFDHMHRFLPALMLRGKTKIIHAPVSHRPRTKGVSKYGTFDRLKVGIPDLLGVWWLMQRPFAQPEVYEDLGEAP